MKKFELYLVCDDVFFDEEEEGIFYLVGKDFFENNESVSGYSTINSVINPEDEFEEEDNEELEYPGEEDLTPEQQAELQNEDYWNDFELNEIDNPEYEFVSEIRESAHQLNYNGEPIRDPEIILNYLNSNWKYFEIVDIISE